MIDHYTVEVFWSDEDKGFIQKRRKTPSFRTEI